LFGTRFRAEGHGVAHPLERLEPKVTEQILLESGASMALHPLPIQPPLFPAEAEEYSRRALALSADAIARCDVRVDIAYGPDPRQTLDTYRPQAQFGRPLPVLLFVHGGGWTNGYKEWVGLLGPSITAFPAILVCVSYRLAPVNRFPAPFEDCVAAITWAYNHIAELGGDPGRIFVGGHASGGHLIALATLRINEFTAAGLPENVIRACFPVSGRFNMVFGTPLAGSAEHRHQSVLFTANQDPIPASPLHQIRKCKTSFLLTYGSNDIPSIIKDNEQMLAALNARGVPAECLILDSCNHFDTAIEIRHPNSPWMQAVRRRMWKASEAVS
jgi:arylformamidase